MILCYENQINLWSPAWDVRKIETVKVLLNFTITRSLLLMSQSGLNIIIISLCHRILTFCIKPKKVKKKKSRNDVKNVITIPIFILFWYNQSDVSSNISTKFHQNKTYYKWDINRESWTHIHPDRQTDTHTKKDEVWWRHSLPNCHDKTSITIEDKTGIHI